MIAEIETDKATIDFSHQDDGFLAKIIQPAGSEDIHVGTILALMVEDAKDIAEVQASAAPAKTPSPAAPAVLPPAAPLPSTFPAAAPAAPLAQHEALPSARILMANLGVDPAALRNRGTGKAGRITKGDVQAFVSGASPIAPGAQAVHAASPAALAVATVAAPAAAAAAPSAPTPASAVAADFGRYTDSKPSNVRKVIASRLTESKARIPHEYAVMDCRIDALLKLRAQVRGAREQAVARVCARTAPSPSSTPPPPLQLKAAGVAVSVNDMVVKAVAKAMVDVPEVNRFFDVKAGVVRAGSAAGVDVCVAVATDGGLITPIVKAADRLGLFGINEAVKDLATRARAGEAGARARCEWQQRPPLPLPSPPPPPPLAGKLQPAEFQGGAFTISNLGAVATAPPSFPCRAACATSAPPPRRPPARSQACLASTSSRQ